MSLYDNGRTQQINQEISVNAKQENLPENELYELLAPMVLSAALGELTYIFALEKSVSTKIICFFSIKHVHNQQKLHSTYYANTYTHTIQTSLKQHAIVHNHHSDILIKIIHSYIHTYKNYTLIHTYKHHSYTSLHNNSKHSNIHTKIIDMHLYKHIFSNNIYTISKEVLFFKMMQKSNEC